MNNFYVYVYFDTRKPGEYVYGPYTFNYLPMYVGKGKKGTNGRKGRCSRHLQNYILEHDTNKLKTNKIKKIIKETGKPPEYIIYKNNILDSEAITIEIDMIKKIGRIDKHTGPLCNLTDGGDTSNLSEASINRIRMSKLGVPRSQATKDKLRAANLGRKASESQKLKMSINNGKYWLGKKLPDSIVAQISKRAKSRYQGVGNPNSKYIYNAISPEGVEFKDILCLSEFIRVHKINASYSTFYRYFSIAGKSSCGWLFSRKFKGTEAYA